MEYLEIIKNVSLALGGSVFLIISSIIFYKIYFLNKKIKELNIEIGDEQEKLDMLEILQAKDKDLMGIYDLTNTREVIILEQKKKVLRLNQKKKNLFEEISIYKIFKK